MTSVSRAWGPPHAAADTRRKTSWGLFTNLMRWHELSFLKTRDTMHFLQQLEFRSLEPERIRALIHVVSNNLGLRLYRSIERTKFDLSESEAGAFPFVDPPVEIGEPVHREDFERWIARAVQQIAEALDGLLEKTGTSPREIDRVFLTGGSSFVPAVRDIFLSRFDAARVKTGAELTSAAMGLALHARDLGLRA